MISVVAGMVGRRLTYSRAYGESVMPRQVMIPPTSLSAEQLASRLLCPGVMMNGDKPFTLRKAAFLKGLRSSGSLEYKRYLASPLRYAGGKSLAVGMITALLPDNVRPEHVNNFETLASCI